MVVACRLEQLGVLSKLEKAGYEASLATACKAAKCLCTVIEKHDKHVTKNHRAIVHSLLRLHGAIVREQSTSSSMLVLAIGPGFLWCTAPHRSTGSYQRAATLFLFAEFSQRWSRMASHCSSLKKISFFQRQSLQG
jgi:hypothetical protein